MTGLRTARGVDLDALADRCGIDVRARWAALLDEELAAGRLALAPADPASGRGATLRATDAGLLVLDAVLRRFFAE
jgi:coproporphyrinogen III oxidase-like Fe-S oxidoreductase